MISRIYTSRIYTSIVKITYKVTSKRFEATEQEIIVKEVVRVIFPF